MKIVLTEKDLAIQSPDSAHGEFEIIKITENKLNDYNKNEDVVAIVCSRAVAIIAARLELPNLKLIQLTSAGFDGVPIEEYRRKGVNVANAGSVYSAPISETVVLGMLLMAKKLHNNPNNRHIKLRRHYDSTITEIAGKKILILGTGNIGTSIANRLQGFDAVVDGYNRSGSKKKQYGRILNGREQLLNNIGDYDYVISTLPDSDETRGFIDIEILNKMSSNAVVVNVGRKAVFDSEALYLALKTGKIKGAVLDVFEKIPNPITNKFRRLRNTMVLPGVSAVSCEVNDRLKEFLSNNVVRVLAEEEPTNVIN